jgi:hypothetical protein
MKHKALRPWRVADGLDHAVLTEPDPLKIVCTSANKPQRMCLGIERPDSERVVGYPSPIRLGKVCSSSDKNGEQGLYGVTGVTSSVQSSSGFRLHRSMFQPTTCLRPLALFGIPRSLGRIVFNATPRDYKLSEGAFRKPESDMQGVASLPKRI